VPAQAIDDARAGGHVAHGHAPGVSAGLRKPRMWLKPDDEMWIASPTLGQLDTRIAW
jgi:hypothetical protein